MNPASRKKLLFVLFLFVALSGISQVNVRYAAARGGLNLRDQPAVTGKLLTKIPYGASLTLEEPQGESRRVTLDGMNGLWKKVTYQGKTGYIPDIYLLTMAPPAEGTKTFRDYLSQLAKKHGKELEVNGDGLPEDGGYRITKQLFENGGEAHRFEGPEYGSVTYFLPGVTVQEGFLLIRMIPEFAEVFTEKDAFPTKDRTFRRGETEYRIKVQREMFGDTPWIERIKVDFEPAAIYSFELYQIDNQLVIFYGAGV